MTNGVENLFRYGHDLLRCFTWNRRRVSIGSARRDRPESEKWSPEIADSGRRGRGGRSRYCLPQHRCRIVTGRADAKRSTRRPLDRAVIGAVSQRSVWIREPFPPSGSVHLSSADGVHRSAASARLHANITRRADHAPLLRQRANSTVDTMTPFSVRSHARRWSDQGDRCFTWNVNVHPCWRATASSDVQLGKCPAPARLKYGPPKLTIGIADVVTWGSLS